MLFVGLELHNCPCKYLGNPAYGPPWTGLGLVHVQCTLDGVWTAPLPSPPPRMHGRIQVQGAVDRR